MLRPQGLMETPVNAGETEHSMTTTITSINIRDEQRALAAMTLGELRHRFADVFGEGTNVRHKRHLVKRILWRIQALNEGGLSERARARAHELAQGADLRLTAPTPPPEAPRERTLTASIGRVADGRLPAPGAVLRRQYKGRTVLVRVLPKGFEYQGEMYRSLSAVANAVTGSHVNGMKFFGLSAGEGER